MPLQNQTDYFALLGALLISSISGLISIGRQVLNQQKVSKLWIVTEYASALLVGYLAYDLYPVIKGSLYTWITEPIFVVTAAHVGSRMFHYLEDILRARFEILSGGAPRD